MLTYLLYECTNCVIRGVIEILRRSGTMTEDEMKDRHDRIGHSKAHDRRTHKHTDKGITG